MTQIIASLCVRDKACTAVCPVEWFTPGNLVDRLAAYKNEMPFDPLLST